MPTDYRFIVTIKADTEEQAVAAMSELCSLQRIETDLDIFTYEATWLRTPGYPSTPEIAYGHNRLDPLEGTHEATS